MSVIIPTRNRNALLSRAVESVLAQTVSDLEVVVVDDASDEPVPDLGDPRVRVVRLESNRGIAGALNAGARAARGRWFANLDDDDRLLPHMIEVSLEALASSPPPTTVVSGIEVVSADGSVRATRLPPTRERGAHWSLEPLEEDRAYEVRNTMLVDRQLLLDVGLFDENMRSSVRNDLFLRLNPVCRIVGLDVVTYQHITHDGARVSKDNENKHASFVHLERKHRALYRAHPVRYAYYLKRDADRLFALGRRREAVLQKIHAARLTPRATVIGQTRRVMRALRIGQPTRR